AFDALFVAVPGLALLIAYLGAADSAVARIEHREIVAEAVGDRNAGVRERSGAVSQVRHKYAFLRCGDGDGGGETSNGRGNHWRCHAHGGLLGMTSEYASSIGEWPDSEFLLADLPEPGEAVRFHD